MRRFEVEEGWSALLFLIGAVMAAGGGIAAAGWTDGLRVVPEAGVVGLLAGFLLGWSLFLPGTAHPMGAVYGLAWIGFLLGRDLPSHLPWNERLADLASRLLRWGQQAITGGNPHDPLIFVALMSGIFWTLGYNAGWNTFRRRQVWNAILPPGVVLIINLYYYRGHKSLMPYLVAYLLCAFLYIVRVHACEMETTWRAERVPYDPFHRYNLLLGGLLVTLTGMGLAWGLPAMASVPTLTTAWQRVSRPWQTVREEWQRLFSTLEGNPATGMLEPFGESLTLGGRRQMADVVLMDIEAPPTERYYWRGAVYSYYDGGLWLSDEQERVPLRPNHPPPGMEQYALRRLVIQKITNYVPGRSLLVGAADPIAVGREAEGRIHLAEGAPLELLRIFSTEPLQAGDTYAVTSLVSEADVAGLRAAGTAYPDWVQRRYLQLPAELPARVTSLAMTITGAADTPFDKAAALEEYLRRNISYTLSPPSVPPGRDYVDYLLFDSHRAYCNGYASAMVILARCVGLPARLAVGYAEGQYDSERGVFRIRELDAHSWPEIYFPGYGWVQFEPTVTESPIVRPERAPGREPNPEANPRPGEGEYPEGLRRERPLPEWDEEGRAPGIEPLTSANPLRIWGLLAGVMGCGLLLWGVWWGVENRGLRHLPPVERAYGRALRFGRYLGRPLRASETPFEWERAFGKQVPEAREAVERIVGLYVRRRFSPEAVADEEAEAAWRKARPLLWKRWLRHTVPSWRLISPSPRRR